MVITHGPLFSLDARGSIAKTLTYSKQRGTTYTKKYAVPTGLPTPAQTSVRDSIRLITQAWAKVADVHRAYWDTLATARHTSRYHAYLHYNAERWTRFLLPTAIPSQDAIFEWEFLTLTVTPYDAYDHLYAQIEGPVDPLFTLAIARSLDPDFSPSKADLCLLSKDWTDPELLATFETDIAKAPESAWYYKILFGPLNGSIAPWQDFEEEA
jgi:hypothetical protein